MNLKYNKDYSIGVNLVKLITREEIDKIAEDINCDILARIVKIKISNRKKKLSKICTKDIT